jgi:hypothetical protein
LVAAVAVIAWWAVDGVALHRGWTGQPYRQEARVASDLAECLGRDVARVVPEGARVHVSRTEAARLSEVYFLQLIEYAFRRAELVGSPDEADLLLTVRRTSGAGCGGVRAAVSPGGRSA